jgi:cobalt/nickel transport protein
MYTRNKTTLAAALALGLTLAAAPAFAHFQMIIPSDDMVAQGDDRNIHLDVMFWHPLESYGMNMERPARFGVAVRGGAKTDLLGSLKPVKMKDGEGKMRDAFEVDYTVKKPGDHVFYIEPQPYWEPSEDSFIVHYTKVVVNGLGMEVGWDEPVGLKAEIIPLTRPYGLWKDNVFQARVVKDGKPVPYPEVEVETYDPKGTIHPPSDTMITQVIKGDQNGVFTYAMPRAGWWGFAALMAGDKPMKHDGENKDVEIGALIWVKAYDMDQYVK